MKNDKIIGQSEIYAQQLFFSEKLVFLMVFDVFGMILILFLLEKTYFYIMNTPHFPPTTKKNECFPL